MDVNGSRSHLVRGEDWKSLVPADDSSLSFDCERGVLRLASRTKLFLLAPNATQPDPSTARPAAADRYGNLFWIDADRRRIYLWNQATGTSQPFWDAAGEPAKPPPAGGFAPAEATLPNPPELLGLAWHPSGYLIVGVPGAVLLLDLARSLEPRRVELASDGAFDPSLVSAAPDGIVWLADPVRGLLMRLDGGFRPCGESPAAPEGPASADPGSFVPSAPDAEAQPEQPPAVHAEPAPTPAVIGAIALEGVAGERAIAVVATGNGVQVVALTPVGVHAGPVPLVVQIDEHDVEAPRELVTHLAVVVDGGRRLVAADRSGSQALSFRLPGFDGEEWPERIVADADFLPLPYFAGRALVRSPGSFDGGDVRFDVDAPGIDGDAAARWIGLRALRDPRFASSGTLVVGGPGDGASGAGAPFEGTAPPPFDSRQSGCVWHRLFVRACLPGETSLTVRSRAHDRLDLLSREAWVTEPTPYRRGRGSALPLEVLPEDGAVAEYEVLLQRARGRYLQLELTLAGNGRVTPHIHQLRLIYPRFSWADRFLPATYVESEDSGRFTERWLANFEGIVSDVEGRIRDARRLFDPRTAPPEALDWLAGWLGIAMDPLWSELDQPEVTRGMRRRLLLRLAPLLYARRGTPSAIRCALEILLHPCPDGVLERLGRVALGRDPAFGSELDSLGIERPQPWSTGRDLDRLLYRYLSTPERPSTVRVVEAFAVRAPGASSADGAHRFTVHIPGGADTVVLELARRLIEVEKPAHTAFEVRPHDSAFRIGGARIGLETQLAPRRGFGAFVLGETELADGYLAAAFPTGERDRFVVGRSPLTDDPPNSGPGEAL